MPNEEQRDDRNPIVQVPEAETIRAVICTCEALENMAKHCNMIMESKVKNTPVSMQPIDRDPHRNDQSPDTR